VERTATWFAVNQDLESSTTRFRNDLRAHCATLHGYNQLLEEEFGPQLPDAGGIMRENQAQQPELGQLWTTANLSRVGKKAGQPPAGGVEEAVDEAVVEINRRQCNRRLSGDWRTSPAECDCRFIKRCS